jgi:type VI protein secretion system component VasF
MRIYIIGNDGITLCREPPAAVDEGEISVASSAELHAARLSGKRLLALWNALPGVEKRRKVADRDALIEQLWSAIEMLPDPQSDAKRPSKQEEVIAMLRRAEGATVDEVVSATGWQRHTVRGVFSGTLKKKLGLTLASVKEERGRVYRIAEPARA